MKSQRSIIIIGAGMAGLAAGCYARMNGFETTIFEMNHRAGGVCQSWERKGYTINGCIHWLVGTGEGNLMNHVWRELGALQDMKIFNHDRFAHFEHPEGKVILYTDVDRLEEHLSQLAPEDKRWIRLLTRSIRVLSKYGMPLMEEKQGAEAVLQNVRLFLTRFPLIREMMTWWRMTIREFAEKLQNPVLKAVFLNFWHPEMSMIAFVMTMAFLNQKIAGYPLGGSSAFIDRIVRRYQELGGKIIFDAQVEEIIVEAGVAKGVRLEDGYVHYADYIISASDGHETIFDLLQGDFIDQRIRRNYEELVPFPSLLFASIGVNRTFEEIPPSVSGIAFPLQEPIRIGDRFLNHLNVQFYNFDPSLAPAGKTTLTIMIEADYDYWRKLYYDRKQYEEEKKKLVAQLIHALEQRFPGISDVVEMTDLSTPVTFHNYTGNYRGSYEGWLPTPKALRTQMPKVLPRLDHFFMAGHWVEPGGGLPPAAMSGRSVIQAICRKEGQEFRSAEPVLTKKRMV